MSECTCEEDRAATGYSSCEIHVHCDSWCGALEEPASCDDTEATLRHYRDHSYMYGCSHGC